jgi:ATP-dependent RNA helicase DDX59
MVNTFAMQQTMMFAGKSHGHKEPNNLDVSDSIECKLIVIQQKESSKPLQDLSEQTVLSKEDEIITHSTVASPPDTSEACESNPQRNKKLTLEELPCTLRTRTKPHCLNPYLPIYSEHFEISQLSPSELELLRRENKIQVKGPSPPRPFFRFDHLRDGDFPVTLIENLLRHGHKQPSPIQMQVIPAGLEGRDVLGSAPTGQGKTLAFLVPVLCLSFYLSRMWNGCYGPYGMVICPTKELAAQVEEVAKSLLEGLPSMKTALLVGGKPIPTQVHRLRSNVQFVAGTPGRIRAIARDHFEFGRSKLCMLVLDEVDAQFKMGLQSEVLGILPLLPLDVKRQTMLFSATLSEEVHLLAKSILQDPLYITIGHSDRVTEVANIYQTILWVGNADKKSYLFSLLEETIEGNVIIFVSSQMGAQFLSEAISKKTRFESHYIHGGLEQSHRELVFSAFQQGAFQTLVSTDVLGRGMNLRDVHLVVNFDMAASVDDYVHRIGRVSSPSGSAITFINDEHAHLFNEFAEYLIKVNPDYLAPVPPQMLSSKVHKRKGRR